MEGGGCGGTLPFRFAGTAGAAGWVETNPSPSNPLRRDILAGRRPRRGGRCQTHPPMAGNPCLFQKARPHARAFRRAIPVTVAPDIAITSTRASNRAVKWEFGRTSQGIRTVLGPCSGQSARGTRQCATVRNSQMSRWRQVRSRASHPAAGAALGAPRRPAGDPADPDVQLLVARCGRLESDVLDPPLGSQPHRVLEEPRQHPRLSVHAGTPLLRPSAEWYRSGYPRSRGTGRATHQKLR